MPKQVSVEEWSKKTEKLIKMDYEEELEQNKVQTEKFSLKTLEKSGFAIRKLVISGQRSAFGKQLFQFQVPTSRQDEVNLASFGITNGDIVAVSTQLETGSKLSGVVLKLGRNSLEVAFDPNDKNLSLFDQAEYFNLIKIANDVTYRRLKTASESLYKASFKTFLVGLLFGTESLQDPLRSLAPYSIQQIYEQSSQEGKDIVWFNDRLNFSQKEAIDFALKQKHLAIIHGPPGTGKTTTLTEVILQLVTRGEKVYVFAPSNVAVDNIFKQLLNATQNLCSKFRLKKPLNFVRLGHPARVDTQLQGYSLDQVVLNSDDNVVADLRKEINDMVTKKDDKRKRIPWGELRELRQQVYLYEKKAYKQSLKDANVIFGTVTSAVLNGQLKYMFESKESGNDFMFDTVIIDECAQALEIACWIPLANAKKCILAGDHKQLPATIISNDAANQGLSVSLIERLVNDLFADCQEKVIRMLTVQYRMNHLIMDWPSEFFYHKKLIADDSVAERRLSTVVKDAKKKTLVEEKFPVIRLVDTVGCNMYELELEDSLSKGNKFEADIVCLYIKQLLDAGIEPCEIGVISPYRLQTSMIEARCRQQFPDSICNELEINSVDAYQGREKEVIILSMVRSNDANEIGFLIEERRLNVAITRARSHLVVIGDSGTITKESKALESFIDYCYAHGDVVTASDYLTAMQQFDDLNIEMKGKSAVATAGNGGKKGKNAGKVKQKQPNKSNRKNVGKVSSTAATTTQAEEGNHNDENDVKRPVANHRAENAKIVAELAAKLEAFVRDPDEMHLFFPETLNAYERHIVHEWCEKNDLQHESHGEGSERKIVVSKK